MALLGMLAAGAAKGASDAANTIRATENAMNFEMGREMLRQQFLERQIGLQAEASRNLEQVKTANEQAKYARDRADKVSDADKSFSRSQELENIKAGGRIALEDRKQSNRKALLDLSVGSSGSAQSSGLVMDDGNVFVPKSNEGRIAVDLVNSKQAKNLADAYRLMMAKGLVSASARSLEGLTDGTISNAKTMAQELLSNTNDAENKKRLRFGVDF